MRQRSGSSAKRIDRRPRPPDTVMSECGSLVTGAAQLAQLRFLSEIYREAGSY